MTQHAAQDPAIDDVLGVICDVALDPKRFEELCAPWEGALWPQIPQGKSTSMESKGDRPIVALTKCSV